MQFLCHPTKWKEGQTRVDATKDAHEDQPYDGGVCEAIRFYQYGHIIFQYNIVYKTTDNKILQNWITDK